MGWPVGNQFWKNRSKHGRDKLFKTPQIMWEAACEYFEWCDNNPLESVEYNGKDAVMCVVPKMRPYTLHGLCLYLDCSTSYFREFKSNLHPKDNETDRDFLTVITRIEETVYNQKFEGAASGFLNPNIIARDLGLSDKKEITSNTDNWPSWMKDGIPKPNA